MPSPLIPQTVQVNIRATIGNEPMENVLHFRYTVGEVTDTAVQALTLSVGLFWADNMLPVLGAGYEFREVYAVDQSTEVGAIGAYVPPSGSVGGMTGQNLPANNALVLTHRTGFAGRSYRGRTYIGGMTENEVNGNFFDGTWVSNVAGAFTQFIADVETSGDWEFVIASRYLNGVQRTEGVATPVLATVARDNIVDSQRRRLPGH